MIIDSLHYWVQEMHVDGFRFDLASILTRDEEADHCESPVLWDIETDPVLSGVKLIAEHGTRPGSISRQFHRRQLEGMEREIQDDVRSFLRRQGQCLKICIPPARQSGHLRA